MLQVLFLTSVIAGVVSLITAICVARLRWRSDVAPFGRRTSAFRVLARPGEYVSKNAVPLVQALGLLGYALVGVAILCLGIQLVSDLVRR